VKLNEDAAKKNKNAVRPFVLYSLRHTILRDLVNRVVTSWTLSRIAGHSNVSMSSRYIHLSEELGSECDGEPDQAQYWAPCRTARVRHKMIKAC